VKVRKKTRLTKKTLNKKKKLKIGVKLQKNRDKNKFGLAKNPLINKSLLLINKKVLLFDKKMCGVARRNWNSAQHHHPHTPPRSTYATQHNKNRHGKKPHPFMLYLFSTH